MCICYQSVEIGCYHRGEVGCHQPPDRTHTLFLYLAVDLYDKHAKCAYLQAVKHPIFVLEHKHTLHREGMAYQAATQPQFKASFSPTSTTPLLLPIPAFPGTGDLVGDFTGDTLLP